MDKMKICCVHLQRYYAQQAESMNSVIPAPFSICLVANHVDVVYLLLQCHRGPGLDAYLSKAIACMYGELVWFCELAKSNAYLVIRILYTTQ